MANQQERNAPFERNRGVLRIIMEQDAGFVAWLSDQFGTIRKRFDTIDQFHKQLETTMGKLEDYVTEIKAAQDETATRVDAIKDDVTALLAAHDTLPTDTGELSPAVEDALKSIRDRAQSILGNAKAVDDLVPPKAPVPTPDPAPAPAAPAEPPGGGL